MISPPRPPARLRRHVLATMPAFYLTPHAIGFLRAFTDECRAELQALQDHWAPARRSPGGRIGKGSKRGGRLASAQGQISSLPTKIPSGVAARCAAAGAPSWTGVNQGAAPGNHEGAGRDRRAMDRAIPNRQIVDRQGIGGSSGEVF
jgi:hypothetical protein